jgi:hypothetical protein
VGMIPGMPQNGFFLHLGRCRALIGGDSMPFCEQSILACFDAARCMPAMLSNWPSLSSIPFPHGAPPWAAMKAKARAQIASRSLSMVMACPELAHQTISLSSVLTRS